VVLTTVLFTYVSSSNSLVSITGIVGKPVKLPCKIDAPPETVANVQWVDLVYNSNADPQPIFGSSNNPQSLVYSSHPHSGNYLVDAEYTLSILNVTLDDPGKYMCISTLMNATTLTKEYYLPVASKYMCISTLINATTLTKEYYLSVASKYRVKKLSIYIIIIILTFRLHAMIQ